MKTPWKALKVVKRYAMTTDSLLMKRRPKAQVRPSRKSSAMAPSAQDLVARGTGSHTVLTKEDGPASSLRLRSWEGLLLPANFIVSARLPAH